MTYPNALAQALDQAVELGEIGVQVAAYRGEDLIVDAWVGSTGPDRERPVDGDTLFPVVAVTKAITLTALHVQAERALVDYDAPVARYWPEFGRHGKHAITVRHVLTHRPGIVTPDLTPEQLGDWEHVVGCLADAEIVATPGETSIYSGYVQGFVLGEVVRRTDPKRRPFGQFVRDELCAPIGVDDLWLGLPESEEARVAQLVSGASLRTGQVQQGGLGSRAVPSAILPGGELYNRPDTHRACLPPSGAIMTARAGARFFAMLANGGELSGARLLSATRVSSFASPRPNPAEVSTGSGVVAWIGTGGYWIGGPGRFSDPLFGDGEHTIGVGGQWRTDVSEPDVPDSYLSSGGGSIGWADLDTRLAVMICHNRLLGRVRIEDHPLLPVADAVRSLAA